MKMKPDHYQALLGMIEGTLSARGTTIEKLAAAYEREGLSKRRFRFDLLWGCPPATRKDWFDLGIYDYLNDDHIHTALKQVVVDLSRVAETSQR